MSVNPAEIHLTEEQKRYVAELAEETGKAWPVVVSEIFSQGSVVIRLPKFSDDETAFDALTRAGVIGCHEGPEDLSTNPKYMEGFGRNGTADPD